MARAERIKEKEKSKDIGEQQFNDLMYSLETKTFKHFFTRLVRSNIFNATAAFTDPLPDFDFDAITREINKRLPALEKHKLEDTKIWLRGPLERLHQLMAGERKTLAKKHVEMTRKEVAENERELEKTLEEIEQYQTKLGGLITAIETIQGEKKKETGIRKNTRQQFEHLNLFDDKDDADTR